MSFVSSQNQLQKMFRDGSVMMKPLLRTLSDALCTLTSSTCAQKKRSLPETLIHGSARKSRNNAGKDCTFGGRTWNATDEGRTSAMLLGVLSRFISVTTFPSQMNRMRCSLHRCNVLPLWVLRDHFKFHDVVLSILGYHRDVRVKRQYVHIRGRYPCQAYIPARRRPNKNRQKVVILKMRECHNDQQLYGEWSLSKLRRRNHGSYNPTVRAAESPVWPGSEATATVLPPCLRSPWPLQI